MRNTISVIVIISFLLTSIPSYAYNRPTLFKEKSQAQKYIQEEKETAVDILKDPSSVDINKKYGKVLEWYKGEKSDKLVIHIQDRHIDEIAQTNIASLIGELTQKYNFYLLSLEGASSELDTSFYDKFADSPIKEKVAKFFVKKGLFTGSEYYKITHKEQYLKAAGAENKKLYLSHLDSYKENQTDKESALSFIKAIRASLDTLKDRIYSKALKELDTKSNAYKNGNIQLADYAMALSDFAAKAKMDLAAYPNVSAFSELVKKEKAIDFAKAQTQRETLIKELSAKLEKNELKQLLEKSLAFKLSQITDREFYSYLRVIASEAKQSLLSYPDLSAYIDYIEYSTKIDYLKLFKELDLLEEETTNALCKNPAQQKLAAYSQAAAMLEELYALKLTNEKSEYINLHRENFNIKNIQGFLREQNEQYGLNISPAIFTTHVDQKAFDNSIKFYEIAIKRDTALIENTLSAIEKFRKDRAILVTGGFHTQGITNILKQKGISYVVICPNVGDSDCEKLYQERMARKMPEVAEMAEFFKATLSAPLVTADVDIVGEELNRHVEAVFAELYGLSGQALGTEEKAAILARLNTIVEGLSILTPQIIEQAIKDILEQRNFATVEAYRPREPAAEGVKPMPQEEPEGIFQYQFITAAGTAPSDISSRELTGKLRATGFLQFVFYKAEDGNTGIIFGEPKTLHSDIVNAIPARAVYVKGILTASGLQFGGVFGRDIEEISAADIDNIRQMQQVLVDNIRENGITRTDAVKIENKQSAVLFINPITGKVAYFREKREAQQSHIEIINELNEQMRIDILALATKNAQGQRTQQPQYILKRLNDETVGGIYTVNADGTITINSRAYEEKIDSLAAQLTGAGGSAYLIDRNYSNLYTIIYGETYPADTKGVAGKPIPVLITQFDTPQRFEDFSMASVDLYKAMTTLPHLKGRKIISGFYDREGRLLEFPGIPLIDEQIVYIHDSEKAQSKYKAILGNKGANVGEMRMLDVPVPGGFVITTNMYRAWLANGKRLNEDMKAAIREAAEKSELLQDGKLDVSARSSAALSMPGMLDTETKIRSLDNLYAAIEEVFNSCNSKRATAYRRASGIPDSIGTAIVVQQMVYGDFNDKSLTGVIFSQNTKTGEDKIYGEYLERAMGEELVSGRARDGGKPILPVDKLLNNPKYPGLYKILDMYAKRLEAHFGYPQEIEFTVENGKLYILQTRNAKATPVATVRMLNNLISREKGEGTTIKQKAFEAVHPLLRYLSLTSVDKQSVDIGDDLAKGIAISPGTASGVIVFSEQDKDRQLEKVRRHKTEGKDVIFVAEETDVEDIETFREADGIITLTGGETSHAANIARALNKPCVVGAESLILAEAKGQRVLTYKDKNLAGFIFSERGGILEGDTLTIDGSDGIIYHGQQKINPPAIDESQYAGLRTFDEIVDFVNRHFPLTALQGIPGKTVKGPVTSRTESAPATFFPSGEILKFVVSQSGVSAFATATTLHEHIHVQGTAIAEGIINPSNRKIEIRPTKQSRGKPELLQDAVSVFRRKFEADTDVGPHLNGFTFSGTGILQEVFRYRPTEGVKPMPTEEKEPAPILYLDESLRLEKAREFIRGARAQGKRILVIFDLDKTLSADSSKPLSERMASFLKEVIETTSDVDIAIITMRSQQEIDSRVLAPLRNIGIEEKIISGTPTQKRLVSIPHTGIGYFPERRFKPQQIEEYKTIVTQILNATGVTIDEDRILRNGEPIPQDKNIFKQENDGTLTCSLYRTVLGEGNDVRDAVVKILREQGINAYRGGRASVDLFPINKGDAVEAVTEKIAQIRNTKMSDVAVIGVDDEYYENGVGRPMLEKVVELNGLALTGAEAVNIQDMLRMPTGAYFVLARGPRICRAVLAACFEEGVKAFPEDRSSAAILEETIPVIYSPEGLGQNYGGQLVNYIHELSRQGTGLNNETALPVIVEILVMMNTELRMQWAEFLKLHPGVDLQELKFKIIKATLGFQDPRVIHAPTLGPGQYIGGIGEMIPKEDILPSDALNALKEAMRIVGEGKHPVFTVRHIWQEENPENLPSIFTGAVFFILSEKIKQRKVNEATLVPEYINSIHELRELFSYKIGPEDVYSIFSATEKNNSARFQMIHRTLKTVLDFRIEKDQETRRRRAAEYLESIRNEIYIYLNGELENTLNIINVGGTGYTLADLVVKLRQAGLRGSQAKKILTAFTWINSSAHYPERYTDEAHGMLVHLLQQEGISRELLEDCSALVRTVYYNINGDARSYNLARGIGNVATEILEPGYLLHIQKDPTEYISRFYIYWTTELFKHIEDLAEYRGLTESDTENRDYIKSKAAAVKSSIEGRDINRLKAELDEIRFHEWKVPYNPENFPDWARHGVKELVWMLDAVEDEAIDWDKANAKILTEGVKAMPQEEKEPVISYENLKPKKEEKGRALAARMASVLKEQNPDKNKLAEYQRLTEIGWAILTHPKYIIYLNDKGQKVRSELENMLLNYKKAGFWTQGNFDAFKKLIEQVPTVERPNEDLFVDVFAGWDDEKLKLLVASSYGGIQFNLTDGCSNQCTLCSLGGEARPLEHMPFVFAIKIMKRIHKLLEFYGSELSPYFDSEPFDYYDDATGARISDVVRHAKEIGYRKINLVTHGLGGRRAEDAKEIASELETEFEISFHIFHHDVIDFLRRKKEGKLSQADTKKEQGALITKYSSRFIPLVQGALASTAEFTIRSFNNWDMPSELATEISFIESKVWENVERSVGKGALEKRGIYIKSAPIVWVNRAALMLKNLGVPEDEIKRLRERGASAGYFEKDHFISIGADGRLTVLLREGIGMGEHGGNMLEDAQFRTVKELFGSYNSKEFKVFLMLLRFIASVKSQELDHPVFKPQELDAELLDFVTWLLKNDPKNKPYISSLTLPQDIEYVTLGAERQPPKASLNYYKLLFEFNSFKGLLPLLKNLNDKNIQKAYNMLRDVPIIPYLGVRINCQGKGKSRDTVLMSVYNFTDPDNPVLQRDLYNFLRRFTLADRAFMPEEGVKAMPMENRIIAEPYNTINAAPRLYTGPIHFTVGETNLGLYHKGHIPASTKRALTLLPSTEYVIIDETNGTILAQFAKDIKPVSIGRTSDNQLALLNDLQVSRHHAEIGVDNEDRVTLKDLGSSNGTTAYCEILPKAEIEPPSPMIMSSVRSAISLAKRARFVTDYQLDKDKPTVQVKYVGPIRMLLQPDIAFEVYRYEDIPDQYGAKKDIPASERSGYFLIDRLNTYSYIKLSAMPQTIGREYDCDLTVDQDRSPAEQYEKVSRQHASVRVDNGNVIINNLQEVNRTDIKVFEWLPEGAPEPIEWIDLDKYRFVETHTLGQRSRSLERSYVYKGPIRILLGRNISLIICSYSDMPAAVLKKLIQEGKVNDSDKERYFLIDESNPYKKPLKLSAAEQTMGRDPDCSLVLADDGAVSRQHASVTVSNGQITIKDLKSKNQTSVKVFEALGEHIDEYKQQIESFSVALYSGAASSVQPKETKERISVRANISDIKTAADITVIAQKVRAQLSRQNRGAASELSEQQLIGLIKSFRKDIIIEESQMKKGVYLRRINSFGETMLYAEEYATYAEYLAYKTWRESEVFKEDTAVEAANTKLSAIFRLLTKHNKRLYYGMGRQKTERDIMTHAGSYLELYDELFWILSKMPDEVLDNPYLYGIWLQSGRVGAGRASSFEDGVVNMYATLLDTPKSIYLATFLHELGHAIHEALEGGYFKGVEEIRKSHETLKRHKAFLGTEFLGGVGYRIGYQYSFNEFLAELNMLYIAQGNRLRSHINELKNPEVKNAWITTYNIFRDNIYGGREFVEYDEGYMALETAVKSFPTEQDAVKRQIIEGIEKTGELSALQKGIAKELIEADAEAMAEVIEAALEAKTVTMADLTQGLTNRVVNAVKTGATQLFTPLREPAGPQAGVKQFPQDTYEALFNTTSELLQGENSRFNASFGETPGQIGLFVDTDTVLTNYDRDTLKLIAQKTTIRGEPKFKVITLTQAGEKELVEKLGFKPKNVTTLDNYLSDRGFNLSEFAEADITEKLAAAAETMKLQIGARQPIGIAVGRSVNIAGKEINIDVDRLADKVKAKEGVFVCSAQLPNADIRIGSTTISKEKAILFQPMFVRLIGVFNGYIENPDGSYPILMMLPAITDPEFTKLMGELVRNVELIASQA